MTYPLYYSANIGQYNGQSIQLGPQGVCGRAYHGCWVGVTRSNWQFRNLNFIPLLVWITAIPTHRSMFS